MGLETCAITNTKEYNFPPICICRFCCPKAGIRVPLAAVNRMRDVGSFGDVGEGGQRETWDPVSSRQRFRETLSTIRPSWAGREGGVGRGGPAALGDRPTSFPRPRRCGSPCHRRPPGCGKHVQVHRGDDPHSNGNNLKHISGQSHRTFYGSGRARGFPSGWRNGIRVGARLDCSVRRLG